MVVYHSSSLTTTQRSQLSFSQKRHGPGSFIHLKLRRKPQAPEGIPAESFLEDTYNLVKEWCEEIAEIDR